MKHFILKSVSCLSLLFLLFTSFTACTAPFTEPSESSGAATDSISETAKATDPAFPEGSIAESESKSEALTEPENREPILADLNNDGTPDQLFITFDDSEKVSATIRVLNGADASELMSESLSQVKANKGAFYLKLGKTGYLNELVYWSYQMRGDEELIFRYSIFNFNAEGEIRYQEQEDYLFDFKRGIASENMVFLTMREAINEHLSSSPFTHDAYLLLDNLGYELQYSTADHLLPAEKLTFTLHDFVNE